MPKKSSTAKNNKKQLTSNLFSINNNCTQDYLLYNYEQRTTTIVATSRSYLFGILTIISKNMGWFCRYEEAGYIRWTTKLVQTDTLQ